MVENPTTTDGRFLLFVSYSCKDAKHPFLEKIRRLFDRPDIKAIATHFMAEDNPEFGEDFIEKVVKALRAANAVLPFLTKASESSPWVNQEIGFAQARGVPVLPAFDHPSVQALRGMIQTKDGCPVDDDAKVQALVDHIVSLARRPQPVGRSEFSAELKGVWWSMHHNMLPMYLRIEVTHAGDKPDALKTACVEIGGRRFETVDRDKLGSLREADFRDLILKFFPTSSGNVTAAKLILQTVRGRTAESAFEAAPSGWRPPELWADFKPY